MTNNFQQIQEFLRFNEPGNFYFIQIYQRRKDNPDMEVDMKVIRDYYLYSQNDLARLAECIIKDCETYNARAYIRLNVRHTDKVALMMMKRLTDLLISGDTKAARNIYQSVCGEFHSDPEKKWLIDLDCMNYNDEQFVKAIIRDLWEENDMGGKIYAEIPTPNGKHLITAPFNLQKFKSECAYVDVHKDNPTILYAP